MQPSGWSVDTLKAYFERILVEQQVALSAALAAQQTLTAAALAAAEKAIVKAETATEKRFEGVNEFRMALSDQAANQITRGEASVQFAAVENRLAGIGSELALLLPREVYDSVLADFASWRTKVDVNATGFVTLVAWERYIQRLSDEQADDRRQRLGLMVAVALSVAGTIISLVR